MPVTAPFLSTAGHYLHISAVALGNGDKDIADFVAACILADGVSAAAALHLLRFAELSRGGQDFLPCFDLGLRRELRYLRSRDFICNGEKSRGDEAYQKERYSRDGKFLEILHAFSAPFFFFSLTVPKGFGVVRCSI